MEAFATVAELEAGWRVLNTAERGVATTLLLRATAKLIHVLSRHHIEIDPNDEVQAENLRTVTCNMVQRVMSVGAVAGMGQVSQSTGSTSASVQYANPDGSLYLTRGDKDMLGLTGGGRIGWVSA